MKYRHSFHAGNFADVHKHVTLLALLEAMQRKDKGFLYLDTHAGRGLYELHGTRASTPHESHSGFARLAEQKLQSEEVIRYVDHVSAVRKRMQSTDAYPGSPIIAGNVLREQDRGIFVEQIAAEARALERALQSPSYSGAGKVRVETGDGFALLRANLPPTERRGLVLIDPPYEETLQELSRISNAMGDALRRFDSAVIAAWYPIKNARDTAAWLASLAKSVAHEMLVSELWLYPCDSRVALNGSGLVIVNPPYQIAERMQIWLPELHTHLDAGGSGGSRVRSYG
jgi:23S rRNA (adenine2030-N6)-methyltransferase